METLNQAFIHGFVEALMLVAIVVLVYFIAKEYKSLCGESNLPEFEDA